MAKTSRSRGSKNSRAGKTSTQQSANKRAQLKAQQAAAAKQKRISRIVIGSVITVAVALIGVLGVVFVTSLAPGGGDVVPPNATDDKSGLYANKDKVTQGAPKVEVFFDYQCSACAQFEAYFGTELTRLSDAGEITLVYRPRTFLDGSVGHEMDASKRAAVASSCAAVQGSFVAYHNALFSLQESGFTDDAMLNDIPGKVGIQGDGLAKFQTCYNERQTLNFVKGANDQAGRDGVTATPTIHVNKKELDRERLDTSDMTSLLSAIKAAAAQS